VHGLEQGSAVLAQLQKEVSLERVEKLMDRSADAVAYQQEIDEALMASMSPEEEESVQAELAKLEQEVMVSIVGTSVLCWCDGGEMCWVHLALCLLASRGVYVRSLALTLSQPAIPDAPLNPLLPDAPTEVPAEAEPEPEQEPAAARTAKTEVKGASGRHVRVGANRQKSGSCSLHSSIRIVWAL
jgi:hypothetical protein